MVLVGTPSIVQRIMRFASPRDGIVRTADLHALGADDHLIQRWLRTGMLRRLHRGVYFVGPGPIPDHARLRAATLRGGQQAYVGSEGVLFLRRIVPYAPPRIELVSTSHGRGFDGVRMRRTSSLSLTERSTTNGIRRTSVARAIVDLATDLTPHQVVRKMRQAEYRGELDLPDIAAIGARLGRRGGGLNLGRAIALAAAGSGGTMSKLEDRLLALMLGAGLQEPGVGMLIPGVLGPLERVDFLWARQRLVIEADGPHHLEEQAQAADRRRDAALRAAGFRVIRFWWWEIEGDPARVLDAIRAAIAA